MKHNIATIINFCTNDYPFLKHCIREAKAFSKQVLIPVSDHFYDGSPENRSLLEEVYGEHPDCEFIEFEYDCQKNLYGNLGSGNWQSIARLIGFYFVRPELDYVFIIDADEIPDAKKVQAWLDTEEYKKYVAMRVACYWYFRESRYQSTEWEDTPLFVRKNTWNGELMLHAGEREGAFAEIEGPKLRRVLGLDGQPMIHHYSWVRTKAQMLKKVVTWGFNWKRDWVPLVEEEFSRPFNGTDFVHEYQFLTVKPYADIELEAIPPGKSSQASHPHVRKIDTEQFHKIDLALKFGIDVCL